ncbi:MAG: hypothetical protein O7E57_14370 [Gammaproteobacteria bacterium]|nr:hypothetical protein [Gammaproteobacteria bacterium]
MRKSTRVSAPLFLIAVYYGFFLLLFVMIWEFFPNLISYMPVGGIDERSMAESDVFIPVEIVPSPGPLFLDATRLALAIAGVTMLIVPMSWVYFITTPSRQIDRSLAQTIVVLPLVVAGIAVIVQDNIALAFSLAGVVAAVGFRFRLAEPAHALYIFSAIAVGLGAGIVALGISAVISVAFVIVNLTLWRLDYGAKLTSPFFSFLTGRDHDDDL